MAVIANKQVNIVAVNALTPHVAWTSAAIVLFLCRLNFLNAREGFQLQ